MTEQEVHEALCKRSDTDKMRLAMMCQLHNVPIQSVERTLATVLTGVQKATEKALDIYKYLEGGTENGRKKNVC